MRMRTEGETLIELLMSVVILGIAAVILITGLRTAIEAGHLHREQAQVQEYLRDWAESLTYPTTCPATAQALAGPSGVPLPAGSTTSVSWSYPTLSNGTYSYSGSSCPGTGDPGVLRVSLQVSVPSTIYPGFTDQLAILVRQP
jgi:type II secretory pathway pseudopilin PulG